MPSPTTALLPTAKTLAVGVRSELLQRYYTLEYDLGLWAFGALQVIKDRRTGSLKTCKAVEKSRLLDVQQVAYRLHRLKEVQHPMISPVTDILEDSQHLFIISSRAAGGDIGDWLDRLAADEETMEEETCASYIAQVLAALVHCHSCGVFHDDLRASSVLLSSRDSDARILLSDVGVIAAVLRGSRDGLAADLRGVGTLALAMLLGLAPSKLEDQALEGYLKSEQWACRSLEAFDFVRLLVGNVAHCTAAHALSHPWLRNVILRPGLPDPREDALRRMACYQVALMLAPMEMAHRDLERLLADFQRMDEDGDGLLASRLAVHLLLGRGAGKQSSQMAVAAVDVRGSGALEFSAMVAAALIADLLPDGSKQRLDLWACLEKLFFEAYGEDGMVNSSLGAEMASNSVGGLLEKHGDVKFEHIWAAFDDVAEENMLQRLMESAGHGTPLALFEWGYLAEEPESWLSILLHACGHTRRREAVHC